MTLQLFDNFKTMLGDKLASSLDKNKKVHLVIKIVDITPENVTLRIGYMNDQDNEFIAEPRIIIAGKDNTVHIMNHKFELKDLVSFTDI